MTLTLEQRVEALERALAARSAAEQPVSYYTSRYSGEEIDERLSATGDTILVSNGSPQTISAALSNKVTVNAGVISDTMDNAIQPGRWTVSVPGSASGNPPDFQSVSTLFGFLDVYTQGSPSWIMQIFSPADDANYIGYVYVRKNINSAGWTSWYRFATATPPQEYSLPLTEGFTPITPCTYWRNQFSEVFVGGSTGGTITDGTVIATLPEGFRPKQTVERPATFAVSGSQAAGSVAIMPDGNISVHGQTSATGVVFSMDFVVAN